MKDALAGRNLLRYYGSGTTRAAWINPLMNAVPHRMFVSPFIGGGNVEIHKPPVQVEAVGDTNGRVTNFMKVLRDNVADLADMIELTPFSEYEFDMAGNVSDDPLEDARRFFLLCWGDINGGPTPNSFRFPSLSRWTPPVDDIDNKTALLYAAAKRIKRWHVYNKDYKWLLGRVTGKPYSQEVVVYLDPPFLTNSRTTSRRGKYYHEFGVQEHVDMLLALKAAERDAKFFLSGYAYDTNGNYDDLYDSTLGWIRYDKEMRVNANGKRIESLWVSPLAAPYVAGFLDKYESWQSGRGIKDVGDYSGIFKV